MRCSANPLLYVKGSLINSRRARLTLRLPCIRNGRNVRLISTPPTHETKGDSRVRLSQIWVPTGGIAVTSDEDSHAKLIRAGFLRQAHSGVFHMLPLGRRVQEKLEALIDKFMSQLGASKLALSSISSEELWSRSGRLDSIGSELFRFQDRKDARYLLSPTHEEEITSLVANTVTSYKDLPIRLYQISRKYRDELRPRHGLLRTREFVMKDLYTFDYAPSLALATYHQVRGAYARLFDELKLPYLVAEADSGDMGGNLSHEFHFPTLKGEDHVINCDTCDYVANEELAESAMPQEDLDDSSMPTYNGSKADIQVWRGISRDRSTLVNVWYPVCLAQDPTPSEGSPAPEVNVNAVKALIPDLDASVQDPLAIWGDRAMHQPKTDSSVPYPKRLVNLVDCRLHSVVRASIESGNTDLPLWPTIFKDSITTGNVRTLVHDPSTQKSLDLLRIRAGDSCPRCPDGRLKIRRAIELGHTFHLGTRYSEPLSANIAVPPRLLESRTADVEKPHDVNQNQQVPLQMGCHGIGVTRIIGAVAETLADEKGLNWPRVMAPFELVIIASKGNEEASLTVYDTLKVVSMDGGGDSPLDLVLDDRTHSFPWKMRDADLVGYPVIVVLGRRWKAEQVVEIQCRRLKIRQELHISEALAVVNSLLSRL
ncbi:related to prolyl-tRNA synthetase [Phialocephala subalpina]|uniref:proline--tRNA ligase n=1 Tax=Phialocephala subalpina TaxID=576137 RepID=A0A1L7XYW0_9HELO|nr:related to prolyl-tRNA synthetase [Phialocephala subalpina]